MKEAKEFIQSLINKGLVPVDELKNPESSYNKLKNMLMASNSNGYLPFFVRSHYKDTENVTLEKLSDFLENLLTLKKFNKSIDLSKYSKTSFEEVFNLAKTESSIKMGTGMPGLIIQEHDLTKIIASSLTKDWYVIVCVKYEKGKWINDHETLLNWGSPRWCIKRDNYWKQYVATTEHLQYVIIHQSIYNEVIAAAKAKTDSSIKIVPINYGTNYEHADLYTANVIGNTTKLRFGLTTKHTDNINNFFENKDAIICFDDANNNVGSAERLHEYLGGFQIRTIDIELRKILGLKRSEFDVSIPTFEEIYKNANVNFEEQDATKISSACSKMIQFMEKISSKKDDLDKLNEEMNAEFIKNPKALTYLMYTLVYMKKVDPEVLKLTVDIFEDSEKVKKCTMIVISALVQISMEKIIKNDIDSNLVEIIKINVIRNFLLKKLLTSFTKDKPKHVVDLKREMIKIFRGKQPYPTIDSAGNRISRSKVFKILAIFLHSVDREYGERVMKGEFFERGEVAWDDEIEFIKKIEIQMRNHTTNDSEFLFNTASGVMKLLPENMYEKIDQNGNTARVLDSYEKIIKNLEFYEKVYSYDHFNHADCLFAALNYYLKKINPKLEKQLLAMDGKIEI